MIEQSTIDRVMAAADIVDVVKDFVALRKAGASWKGLCPFHEDRTPSFIVTPAKQLCKCFACGAGGNVVKFVQLHEQLNYPEAIKWLANKYGIEVEESGRTDEQKERSKERESMFVVNEWARQWFEDMLHNDVDGIAIGMNYFRGRGFRDDIIRKFQLGYCPDRPGAMSQAALQAGHEARWLVNDPETRLGTGLSYANDKGGLTDRYRGRVIFPIHTVSGRTVGFGGRVLAKATKGVNQKYVNSPESTIYSKSRELYGLYQAKQAISRLNCCYIVEGYTDVISMHQCGVENVVASSGTALTTGQIALLHRFTPNVTMLFDGDAAGIKAALRGTDMLLSQGLNIKVLLLPDGEDPDSFARSHKAEELRQYIAEHEVDFIRFKTDILLADCANDPVRKAEVVNDIVASISVIPDDILRQTYAHECAEQMRMAESVIVKAIADRRKQTLLPAQNTSQTTASTSTTQQQEDTQQTINTPADARPSLQEFNIIRALIRYGALSIALEDGTQISVAQYVGEDLAADDIHLQHPLCQRVLELANHMANIETLEQKAWTARFTLNEDEALASLAAEACNDRYELSATQQQMHRPDEERLWELIPRLLYDLKYDIITQQVNAVMQQIRQPEVMHDPIKIQALMQEYRDLSSIQREVGKLLGDRTIKK